MTLHYRLSGPGDAPVFCLLHCFGADHRYWDLHREAFEGCRLLCVDVPGHGMSPLGPEGCSLESLAAEVVRLLDLLEFDAVHLCGVSFGGQIAQTMALDHPGRVLSLALVTSTCRYDDDQRALWQSRADLVERDGLEPVTGALMRRWFTPEAAERRVPGYVYMEEVFRRFRPATFAAAARAMCALDTESRLGQIAVPALVVASPDDPGVPRDVSERMARLIPGCGLHWIAPSRHLASLEQPEQFNRLMRRHVVHLAR